MKKPRPQSFTYDAIGRLATDANDLCLLAAPLREALAAPGAQMVRTTIIAGRLAFAAN